MKQLLKENRSFIFPYLIFLLAAICLLIIYTKPELHIFSNQLNSPFFDIFFKYATNLGDGVVIAFLFIVLLAIKYRYALAFLSGSLVTALLINILKKIVFHNMYRPSKYFELYETYHLHLVDGVKMNVLQSFPSGHTGTAFNVFFALALMVHNRWLKFFFFLMALIVAYSRVYLSQHFLIDITVGSIIGTTIMLFTWYLFSQFEKPWLNKSILTKRK